MTEPEEKPDFASRLGQSRIGLRKDLEVTRHVFRSNPAYVIRDPMTFQSHRVSVGDYQVMVALRPDRTLAETLARLVEDGVLREADEDHFYEFVISLHRLGFLHLPISDDKALHQRHMERVKAKSRQKLLAPFFLQIPIIDPDAFLDRTIGYVRPFFRRGGRWLWGIVVGLAAIQAVMNAGAITAPLGQVLIAGNLPVLWLTLIGLKVVHEFGHAFACKFYGGRVPEMGVYLIAGTPCAYVDTSASWAFTRKRERLFVCFAGIYVELFVAAIALFVWLLSDPSMLKSVAYNVMLLSSVVTIGFNLNPLMRYDGYYALSDLLEIPNLRARATRISKAFAKRITLGIPSHEPKNDHLHGFMLVFGLLSSVYRITVVLSISAVIASKAFLLGVTLGGVYLGMEAWKALRNLVRFLWFSHETATIRARATGLALVLFVLLPLGVMAVPLPSLHTIPGVVGAAEEDVVRAGTEGFVTGIEVEVDRETEAGDLLVELIAPGSELLLMRARADLEAAHLRLDAARYSDPVEARIEADRVAALEEAVSVHATRDQDRRVRTPRTGRVVTCLDDEDIGRWVRTGEPVATVISGKAQVTVLLTEDQLVAIRPRPGDRVEFRSSHDPDLVRTGAVARESPEATERIEHPALTQIGGGEIAVAPASLTAEQPYFELDVELDAEAGDLLYGSTGRVRFSSTPVPVGRALLRRTLRFANRLRHGS